MADPVPRAFTILHRCSALAYTLGAFALSPLCTVMLLPSLSLIVIDIT
jgi:hypothetical protein